MSESEISLLGLYIAILGLVLAITIPFIVLFFQEWRSERRSIPNPPKPGRKWERVKEGKTWIFFSSLDIDIPFRMADKIKISTRSSGAIELLHDITGNAISKKNLVSDKGRHFRRQWQSILTVDSNGEKILRLRLTPRFIFPTRVHFKIEKQQPEFVILGGLDDLFKLDMSTDYYRPPRW